MLSAALLNAFQARPATGNILFPSPVDLAPLALVPGLGEAVSETVNLVLNGVEGALNDGGAGPPYPLPETGGEWAVNEFTLFSAETGYIQLVHRSGRFLFLANMENSTEVFAGTQSRGVLYSVANSVDQRDGRISTLFQFGFFDGGVRCLRAFLGRREAPLYEVALALADEIYRSGQYSPALSRDRMSLQDLARRRVHGLTAAERGAALVLSPESREVLAGQAALEVCFGGPPDYGAGVLFPGALSDDGREYLSICLQNSDADDRAGILPLHPVLQERLWDVSTVLAAASFVGNS